MNDNFVTMFKVITFINKNVNAALLLELPSFFL